MAARWQCAQLMPAGHDAWCVPSSTCARLQHLPPGTTCWHAAFATDMAPAQLQRSHTHPKAKVCGRRSPTVCPASVCACGVVLTAWAARAACSAQTRSCRLNCRKHDVGRARTSRTTGARLALPSPPIRPRNGAILRWCSGTMKPFHALHTTTTTTLPAPPRPLYPAATRSSCVWGGCRPRSSAYGPSSCRLSSGTTASSSPSAGSMPSTWGRTCTPEQAGAHAIANPCRRCVLCV